jgi:hypothetical protein
MMFNNGNEEDEDKKHPSTSMDVDDDLADFELKAPPVFSYLDIFNAITNNTNISSSSAAVAVAHIEIKKTLASFVLSKFKILSKCDSKGNVEKSKRL